MAALQHKRPRVAVVWRGDRQARDSARADTSRLAAVFTALGRRGLETAPAVYDEAFADRFREQIMDLDAVLVWVDPISGGRRRHELDNILREVAASGVFVSAHPDVIAKMGVKAVLHRARTLGWGTDTDFYDTPEAFETRFPSRLSTGPRVLKQNRGNGGVGVWKVERVEDDSVRVQEARGQTGVRTLPLQTFMHERHGDFGEAGGLVDQPFQVRHLEGMVRCYMSGVQVVGFGHQLVRALADPEAGPAGPRLYSGPDDPRFQDLRLSMEQDWAPGMASLLDIRLEDLPVIWDADFLLGPKTHTGADSYVLCEINASSVFPIPDQAPDALAATLADRLSAVDQAQQSSPEQEPTHV